MMRSLTVAFAACLTVSSAAAAPRVLFDTEAGPILLELDDVRAPRNTANLLRYVNDGFYDGLIFHRSIRDFVIQAGRFDQNGQLRLPTYSAIAGEPRNGLSNRYGTIAMALSGSNVNSARSEFFINTADNTSLDGSFTVFGRVVYGMGAVEDIDERRTTGDDAPFRPVLITRAVQVADGAFPILDAHSGSWFDPANSGRGIVLEIASDPEDATRRILIAYGYDYRDGAQVWVNGAQPFAVGDHEVTVAMQTASGADFGSAFAPGAVLFDTEWGSLHIRFSSCDLGTFTYTSRFGDSTQQLTRITTPPGRGCEATE
ncbi:peptidylprolyl isomerase [Pseudomarimonas salicorniae]|uniref:peptidylprolyl isomerase n=1 Tax=Pseudomarimonas salicorniae TaxID=2933270 RepID=A0ABT0GCN6_9GAMM|nr:peptidylprolyl isomerase [Lysobacter sp. CAU 1642]MCK7592291.1 peptidylprolyl isomerase [Lysobacter sp. CAU 1642]